RRPSGSTWSGVRIAPSRSHRYLTGWLLQRNPLLQLCDRFSGLLAAEGDDELLPLGVALVQLIQQASRVAVLGERRTVIPGILQLLRLLDIHIRIQKDFGR